jgi:hypothetical protein
MIVVIINSNSNNNNNCSGAGGGPDAVELNGSGVFEMIIVITIKQLFVIL